MGYYEIEKLNQLKTVAEELGYAATVLSQNPDRPFDMLSIQLDDEETDEEQALTLTIYPLSDELEGSILIQFFLQYPFQLTRESLAYIIESLPGINNKLPLGNFNISEDQASLYFKYVLSLPLDYQANAPFLNDILDMCIYPYEHYFEHFEALVIRSA